MDVEDPERRQLDQRPAKDLRAAHRDQHVGRHEAQPRQEFRRVDVGDLLARHPMAPARGGDGLALEAGAEDSSRQLQRVRQILCETRRHIRRALAEEAP